MILRMINSVTSGVIVAAGLTIATVATAAAEERERYSVSDVVEHFTRSADLGRSRALCIGTPSECGEVEEATAPEPFNLQVQFEFNSAELTPEARRQLDVFAEAATGALSRASFKIDGHTDAVGGEVVNQNLSERRAASVVRYLAARGVDPDRLIAEGHGESQPLVDDPFDGRNRRVEASLAGIR